PSPYKPRPLPAGQTRGRRFLIPPLWRRSPSRYLSGPPRLRTNRACLRNCDKAPPASAPPRLSDCPSKRLHNRAPQRPAEPPRSVSRGFPPSLLLFYSKLHPQLFSHTWRMPIDIRHVCEIIYIRPVC